MLDHLISSVLRPPKDPPGGGGGEQSSRSPWSESDTRLSSLVFILIVVCPVPEYEPRPGLSTQRSITWSTRKLEKFRRLSAVIVNQRSYAASSSI